MADQDVPEPLPVLLTKLAVAVQEENEARLRVYALKDRAYGPLGLFRRDCPHGRILHVRSTPYVTEADDFHRGDHIVVCHDPLRICLDCGLIEQSRLAEMFKDACPRDQRVRVGRDQKREDVLKRQGLTADRSVKFFTLKGTVRRRIDSTQLEDLIGRRSSDLHKGFLEPEQLYEFWRKYGQPKTLAQSPKE